MAALSPLNHRWRNFRPMGAGLCRFGCLAFCFSSPYLPSFWPMTNRYSFAMKARFTCRYTAYAETEFSGDFATEADYRDPFVILIEGKNGEKDGYIIWPLLRYSYDTINLNLDRPARPRPAPKLARHG